MSQVSCRELCQPWLGRPGPVTYSAREVTLPAIWNFLEAVEDGNPVYWDQETARASRFGRLIAPPQYLMAACMGHWWAPDFVRQREQEAVQAQGEDPLRRVLDIVRQCGYVVATNVTREEEYLDVWGPGDGRIKQQGRVVDVSEEKRTRVGRGVFITTEIEYRTEVGDRPIARARNVLLLYRPDGQGSP
jgi:hypothetical protein